MSEIKPGCLAWINQGEHKGTIVEVTKFRGEHPKYGRLWHCRCRDKLRIPSIYEKGKEFHVNEFSCREVALTPINDPDQVTDDITELEHAS